MTTRAAKQIYDKAAAAEAQEAKNQALGQVKRAKREEIGKRMPQVHTRGLYMIRPVSVSSECFSRLYKQTPFRPRRFLHGVRCVCVEEFLCITL